MATTKGFAPISLANRMGCNTTLRGECQEKSVSGGAGQPPSRSVHPQPTLNAISHRSTPSPRHRELPLALHFFDSLPPIQPLDPHLRTPLRNHAAGHLPAILR